MAIEGGEDEQALALRRHEPMRQKAVEQFGNYQLLERIAIGGTAEVFRARRLQVPNTAAEVVLKRILPQYAADPDFCQILREEAQLMAELHHPQIVELVDFGVVAGTAYLALEYVDGLSLANLLDVAPGGQRRLAPFHAAQIALATSQALDYLHERGGPGGLKLELVHRDVSPQNILLARSGAVKLADFGIAKSLFRASTTVDGTIKGKLAYMSPEQAHGDPTLGAASDIFALGAVLYEMLFGVPPLQGASDLETIEAVKACSYRLEPSWLPDEDAPLLAIVRRCLERLPASRYRGSALLSNDLERYLDRAPAPVLPLNELITAGAERWSRRRQAQLAAARMLAPDGGGTAVIAQVPQAIARTALERPGPARSAPDAARRPARALAMGGALALVLAGVIAFVALRGAPAPTPGAAPPALPPADYGPRLSTTQPAQDAALRAPVVSRLVVATQPGPAEARVDGVSLGKTPLVISPTTASFLLELRRPGFKAWRRRLSAPRGERRLSIGLQRLHTTHGYLTINSIPWAHVFVDGRRVGTTPIRKLRLPAGRRRIRLRDGAGRLLQSFNTTIRAAQTRVFRFDGKSR